MTEVLFLVLSAVLSVAVHAPFPFNAPVSLWLSENPQPQRVGMIMCTEFTVLSKNRTRNENHFPKQFLTVRRTFMSTHHSCIHQTSQYHDELQSTNRTRSIEIKTMLAKQRGSYIMSK